MTTVYDTFLAVFHQLFALEESQGKEFDTIGEFFEDEICGLYGC